MRRIDLQKAFKAGVSAAAEFAGLNPAETIKQSWDLYGRPTYEFDQEKN